MKKLLVLILVFGIVPVAVAQITPEVYQADGRTLFDCNDDIMVGSKLAIIVSSDSNDYWSGGLFIEGQDRALGTLAGRDLDPNTRNWTGSHYGDAGDFARVTAWKDSSIWGFDLYTFYPVDGNSEDNSTVAGEWFVIDYEAVEVGNCNVGFYDYGISWEDPNYFLSFSHTPTRDLNSDDRVDFIDFAIFTLQWNATDCNDPNWYDGADLNRDGNVDCNDLGLFAEYWLWPTMNTQVGEDPNIIYSIVDANGSNEITIDINDSITLYVDVVTTEENNVCMFDIEVNISDTNLGSIDNTEIDSNDPPGTGTARILAEPRDPSFDYWRPGLEQEEGIELVGASMSSAMSDGHLASFVFTCEGQGDVALEMINWNSSNTGGEYVFPKLESIIIHQGDSQQMMGAGMGDETSGMPDVQEEQQYQATQGETDELVSFLDEIWAQEEEIRETCSETEWNEFIDKVINSCQ